MELDTANSVAARSVGGGGDAAPPPRRSRRPVARRLLPLCAVPPLACAGLLVAAPDAVSRAQPSAPAASPASPHPFSRAASTVEAPETGLQVLPSVRCSANDVDLRLPSAPEGVSDLRLNEILQRPFGERGLEFTAKARSLDGKRVRIAGYMVRNCRPQPARFLLAAVPVALHVSEMGPCDDLPPETVLVELRNATPEVAVPCVLPYTPSLLVATGTLRLGRRTEREGPIASWIRLEVAFVPPGSTAAKSGTASPRIPHGAPSQAPPQAR